LSHLKHNIEEQIDLLEKIKELDAFVNEAIVWCTQTVSGGGKILLCGNGGSASDCQHIAAELVGRFLKERRPLPAIALTTDTSALTAIANDYGYPQVFSRQLGALANPGDTLIAISTSGNSENVIAAVNLAKSQALRVIGLLGRDGGRLKELCDISIVVPSDSTPRIQEAHILIGHTICEGIEMGLGLV
jgi:D-sedoheptulose 7-phosphate isomerase